METVTEMMMMGSKIKINEIFRNQFANTIEYIKKLKRDSLRNFFLGCIVIHAL